MYMVIDDIEDKILENYIILLLGVQNKPIPSLWHLQKEMFMLSKANPMIEKYFDFKQHYNGPYNQRLAEITQNPLCYDNAWEVKDTRINLTDNGKQIFETLKQENQSIKKFSELLKTIKLIRIMYDKLDKHELLFLIYQTYPTYQDKSSIYEKLVVDDIRRKELANSLLIKGIVTEQRYQELLNIGK